MSIGGWDGQYHQNEGSVFAYLREYRAHCIALCVSQLPSQLFTTAGNYVFMLYMSDACVCGTLVVTSEPRY